jgi:hypothetical protein
MYILVAVALAMSLFITVAAPAQKVSAADCADAPDAKWSKVSTPTEADWVLAPCSVIVDFAVAAGGEEAYAIVYSEKYAECPGCVTCTGNETQGPWYLLKSDDGAATWESVTKAIKTLIDKKFAGNNITELLQVACDAADPNYVYVALTLTDGKLYVFASTDGGSTFKDTATITGLDDVIDLEVSPAVDNVRELAISGPAGNVGKIFRYVEGVWEDTSKTADYPGWLSCKLVTDIRFSPSWETDNTIVAVTANANATDVYLQTGTWGETPIWKNKNIVTLTGAGKSIATELGGATAGVTLPLDYSGTKADTRWLWVWVNYKDGSTKVGEIYYVKGDNKNPIGMQIEGKPWLTHVSYQGYRASGKAIAGLMDPEGNCGEGIQCFDVQVYRIGTIKNMDLCGTCEPWLKACKPPTGAGVMAAFYVSEDKAYAVAKDPSHTCYDEGAWSVSFDDGDTWNQVSLIDTKIDYLSDVAVSPDCNKTMLVSANVHKVDISYNEGDCACECDSVWLHAVSYPEAGYGDDAIGYDGHWLRTWCGQLEGNNAADFPNYPQRGLLRLAPPVNGDAESEMGYIVYLVDRMTTTVYWNEMEGLACWNSDKDCGRPKIDNIVDLAVKDNQTIYALSSDGKVAMADEYACSWAKPVDSLVCGWTIAVHGNNATNVDVLVGDAKGEVSYSDDGGATFTKIEKVTPVVGRVTVAFDSYFDTNDTIYAAVDGLGATNYCGTLPNDGELGGIYRWVIDKSVSWQDLGAEHYAYTGLVLGRLGGNPKTSAVTGGVLYASYIAGDESYGGEACTYNGFTHTGVARSLNPNETSACKTCVTWDYLIVPLTAEELFTMAPHALKLCGCKDATTDTKLFAIDGLSHTDDGLPCESGCPSYDMCQGKDGTVWTFDDCYAKKAPELTVPVVVPADPCTCYSAPFSVTWACLCDACQFEIEFALDEDFTMPVAVGGEMGTGDNPSFSVIGGEAGKLSCEMNYYVRVRASESGTCQVIHSWWSTPVKFTVAPSTAAGEVHMGGPASGAQDIGIAKVPFTWDVMANADKYDWVLSKNADLSNPVESVTGLTSPAYTCTKTLEWGTPYYWQVKAYKGGALLSTSPVGSFTTAPTSPCLYRCPIDGLCFDTQTALQTHYDSVHKQPGTPMWVWIVIAIGAILVIVVIVLIFRTRRV